MGGLKAFFNSSYICCVSGSSNIPLDSIDVIAGTMDNTNLSYIPLSQLILSVPVENASALSFIKLSI
jgi:hypothetical protein